MPFFINIHILKANGVNQNGNIDTGAVVHNSHTANSKYVGVNLAHGDLSPVFLLTNNNVLDSDISDQDQIANVSVPVTGQV